ncbi:MAG: hypothetical protein GEU97_01355 [Actinophytocola sp.]|nr:hypothetical protein [Actinophytocola sp.]
MAHLSGRCHGLTPAEFPALASANPAQTQRKHCRASADGVGEPGLAGRAAGYVGLGTRARRPVTVATTDQLAEQADVLNRSGSTASTCTASGTPSTPWSAISASTARSTSTPEELGKGDVVLVGFGSHRGSVIASDAWGGPVQRMPVPAARASSIEAECHHALPLHPLEPARAEAETYPVGL